MNRRSFSTSGLLLLSCAVVANSHQASGQTGWTTLFDGTNLNNFTQIGNANWMLMDGAVVADKGNGFLVTKESYGDFEIRAEFWVNDDANSGIFIRCADPAKVSGQNATGEHIRQTPRLELRHRGHRQRGQSLADAQGRR